MHTRTQESELVVSSFRLTSDIPRHSEAVAVWRAPGLVVGEDAGEARAENDQQQAKRTAPKLVAAGRC